MAGWDRLIDFPKIPGSNREKGNLMAKGYSRRASGGSSGSGRGYGSRSNARAAGAVSAARLDQKSGSGNSFGGYTKVNHSNGTFSMRRTEK